MTRRKGTLACKCVREFSGNFCIFKVELKYFLHFSVCLCIYYVRDHNFSLHLFFMPTMELDFCEEVGHVFKCVHICFVCVCVK